MRTMKIFTTIAAGTALLLTGCHVKDPIYHTSHPDRGSITLITDWSATNIAMPPASGYTVEIAGYSATLKGEINAIDYLFDRGDCTIGVHNTAAGIAVNGTAVRVASEGNGIVSHPDWLYTGFSEVTVEKDTRREFTVSMVQQVRELTLVIELEGGSTERIAGITGTLHGVAGILDFASGIHGSPSTVAMVFAKDNDGKWTATVRLLGVAGGVQKLTGKIAFMGGRPEDQPLDSDLSAALSDFNVDKKTPLTLGATVVETPTAGGLIATIKDWNPISGGSVIAD